MSSRGTWLVAGRELTEAFRRRSFWIIFGILVIGSSAGMILPEVFGGGTKRYDVGIVGATEEAEETIRASIRAQGLRARMVPLDDRAAAERAVRDDETDVSAVLGRRPMVVVQADDHERLVGAVQQALAGVSAREQLEEAGLSPAEAERVLAGPVPSVERIDADQSDRRGAAAVVAIVLYLLLFSLMIQVANGVAIEKANRISEVLLAIVRPGSLLFGKVIGVGLAGLVTLLGAGLPVVVKLASGGDLPDGMGGVVAGAAAWFVLGTALYLIMAGALGALVERQEEAGSAITPLSMLLVGSYLVATSAPDSALATVLAYLPLSSPLVMPSRLALGAASTLEIVVSLVLAVLAVLVAARFGATIYRRAVVRTGRKLTLREVLQTPPRTEPAAA